MTVNEPPLGYTHALTIDEAVGRMIGYEAQPMPFDEVLDCAIEQADSQYERAKDCDSPADKLSALEDRIQHLTLTRTKAMILHNELHTVADELAQGLSHPTLVLCSIAYADRLPRFTIASLYPWAKSCHATEIPEWAPQTQTQLGQQNDSASDAISGDVPTADETSLRRLDVLLYIVADALASMIHQLSDRDGTEFKIDGERVWDDEEGQIIPATLARYLHSICTSPEQPALHAPGTEGLDGDSRRIGTMAILGVTTQSLAKTADQARTNGWNTFRGKDGDDMRAFRRKDGYFSTSRTYDYLARYGCLLQSAQGKIGGGKVPGLGKRTVNERLNEAKSYLKAGYPAVFGIQDFETAFKRAADTYSDLTS